MVLPLITPQPSDFLRDFPGQNAVNMDLIDAYAGPCLPSDALQPITPDLTSNGTKPSLGASGTHTAFMYQIFDQVWVWGQFRFAAGFSIGTGIYIVQIPIILTTALGSNASLGKGPLIGTGSTFDADSNNGRLPLTVHQRTSTQIQFGIRINHGTGNRELRESGYVTWAAGDGVDYAFRAKRAV